MLDENDDQDSSDNDDHLFAESGSPQSSPARPNSVDHTSDIPPKRRKRTTISSPGEGLGPESRPEPLSHKERPLTNIAFNNGGTEARTLQQPLEDMTFEKKAHPPLAARNNWEQHKTAENVNQINAEKVSYRLGRTVMNDLPKQPEQSTVLQHTGHSGVNHHPREGISTESPNNSEHEARRKKAMLPNNGSLSPLPCTPATTTELALRQQHDCSANVNPQDQSRPDGARVEDGSSGRNAGSLDQFPTQSPTNKVCKRSQGSSRITDIKTRYLAINGDCKRPWRPSETLSRKTTDQVFSDIASILSICRPHTLMIKLKTSGNAYLEDVIAYGDEESYKDMFKYFIDTILEDFHNNGNVEFWIEMRPKLQGEKPRVDETAPRVENEQHMEEEALSLIL